MSTELLPPVAPDVLADAVEQLSARLRKKLDAAISGCADQASATAGRAVEVHFGEDATVTLRPGPSGTVTNAEQAVCTCLLAPRCLHRAAVLGAAPIADGEGDTGGGDDSGTGKAAGSGTASDTGAGPEEPAPTAPTAGVAATVVTPAALTAAQVLAATALWDAAAEALSAGVTAGGAVVQAELLRAAHTARLAGLPRAEAAALRVVRSLRAARERSEGQRLADLTGAFRELLVGTAMLASGSADTDAAGSARRVYEQGGSLRVYGLCREPVLSATGYGGVTTHLVGSDGAGYTVSDVRPGGLARVKGAGSASVALGGAVLDHAGLARGGLRIVGATVSADGRLGAGRGSARRHCAGWTGPRNPPRPSSPDRCRRRWPLCSPTARPRRAGPAGRRRVCWAATSR